jgi:hypothetical protein
MKVYSFSQFMLSKKTNENSDLDWSDKNWDERGMSGENPPNSGFEGTSSEPMNYSGGDYGENPEETIEDETGSDDKKGSKQADVPTLESIKEIVDDLSERITKIEEKRGDKASKTETMGYYPEEGDTCSKCGEDYFEDEYGVQCGCNM